MVRKRCKHAAGLKGAAKARAWRACRCAWGVDLYIDDARVWHNLGADERAARVAELRLRADLEEGRRPSARPGAGFRDMAEDWYARKKAQPDARVASIRGYRSRIDHAVRYLGDKPVSDLTQTDIDGLARGLLQVRSAATARSVLGVVSAVITHAARQGAARPRVMFTDLVPAHTKTGGHTVPELLAVIAVLEDPWCSMAEFALLTGLRRGELLGLTVGHVRTDRVEVVAAIGVDGQPGPLKTAKSARVVTLTPRAAAIAAGRVAAVRDGRLWPGTPHDADTALRDGMTVAGVYRRGNGWHTFRHAHTALLNESGVSLRDSAARLGHGAHYAQSLAYGWASEQTNVNQLDEAVTRHGRPPG